MKVWGKGGVSSAESVGEGGVRIAESVGKMVSEV